MKTHLNYCLMTAYLDCGESRHAQTVMESLGITYQHATPQSIGDSWWFWNCENLPEQLPVFLKTADWNPMEMIGWGLSEKDALKIKHYKA